MADRDDDDDWVNHKVGFKRPPPWARFQKGQSGNPKGRPKGTGKKQMGGKQPAKLTEFEQLVSELLGEQVTLLLGGGKVSMTKKRAILLNLFKQAMNGQPLAMRELNRIIEKVEAKEEARARAGSEAEALVARNKAEQDAALFLRLVELKDKQAKAWARASAESKEEPEEPWPHPDDILLDHFAWTAKVRGPIEAKGVAAWEQVRRSRDHSLARVVYHTCLDDRIDQLISRMWLTVLVECDSELPKRWQISHDIKSASIPFVSMSSRTLEALVQRGALEFEANSRNVFRSKATYQHANGLWGPVIKMLGFRSLRHLESAGELAAN